jgi:hypothetical protein
MVVRLNPSIQQHELEITVAVLLFAMSPLVSSGGLLANPARVQPYLRCPGVPIAEKMHLNPAFGAFGAGW